MKKILIVGARSDSLGEAIANLLRLPGENVDVVTAGISGEEDLFLNISHPHTFGKALIEGPFDYVIVTAGMNVGYENYANITDWMNDHFDVNCIGPMNLLRGWILHALPSEYASPSQFIAVSSNSAHIARTNSMAYCASKAALSMAIRVAAREEANGERRALIYGYEPGLMKGTGMTQSTEERFGPSQTRIPGNAAGLETDEIAAQIVSTMRVGTWAMNGVLVRLDGGEQ